MSEPDRWGAFEAAIRASSPYASLRAAGGGGVARLPLAAAAWVLDLLARDLERPLLVMVPREADAVAWTEAARLFGRGAERLAAPSLTPYHEAGFSRPVAAEESRLLDRLARGRVDCLVVTPRGLFRRLPTPAGFEACVREIRAGVEQPVDELVALLEAGGYRRADLVTEVGDYAVRGGVFDLYPPGEPAPVRLDLLGDAVESVRRFDPDDQRSLGELEVVRVLPLVPLACDADRAGRLAETLAGLLGDEVGMDAAEKLAALRERGRFTGWEHYLPLGEETAFLADHLPGALTVSVDRRAILDEVERHAGLWREEFEARRARALLAVEPELLEQPEMRVSELVGGAAVRVGDLLDEGGAVDFEATTTDLFHGQLPRFPREWETARARGDRLVIVARAEHEGRIERLCETYEMPLGAGGIEVADGELERGFRLPAAGLVVYGERQLFPRLAPRAPQRRAIRSLLTGLRDLRVGDFVVHADHGVGQFVGLRSVGGDGDATASSAPAPVAPAPAEAQAVEVMEISYAGDRSLLVPLGRLDLVQKYSGIDGVSPRLDRLGGTSWSRKKERVRSGMRQLAGDLLALYAERRLAEAPALGEDTDLQAQFEATFDYEETPDQLEASAAIKQDLERRRPMDRLLVGDVGFGKTEVAMRAAFKVVDGGHQVAVLAPTTILADQHFETFRRRFAEFPVTVEMVSRFRTAAEIRTIREALAEGRIDVLVGTHRLLSRDIELPRLGLLIIDEEQRFGVAQKERLRQLKKQVHVLSMTATPVPRTLQLSLAGVRDLSVIETPPQDRMAVETAIVPFDRELIREAIEFERERGGQVYFVYNRVEGIEEMAGLLREVVPDLKLTIGHGQMEERRLAERMHAFKRGEYDLLLATTIIEKGIDISNVNTMLIHRADRFGLAQLYQLRGRVGRSTALAYCYLMVPSDRVLSEESRRRLEAIREFTDLGSGFRIAARDLEIRGAGNLLGAEQSGHIAAVGIETYLKLLEEAVRELRGETVEAPPAVSLDLPVQASIPDGYVGDPNMRLELYRRIAAGEEADDEVLTELRDRFGPPPREVRRLVSLAGLKRLAERLRVQTIAADGGQLKVRLRHDSPIDVERLIRLVSEMPGASFSPGGVLSVPGARGGGAIDAARRALEALAP